MIPLVSQPLLLVVSAPSGAGKTTLCDRLRAEFETIEFSISCTTRPPRPGEQDGREYYFIREAEFERRIEEGEFLEHAVVHGARYGTLRAHIRRALEQGRDILMDIDVQGAAQVRDGLAREPRGDILSRSLVDIFIAPPSVEALESRLRERNKDDEATIRRRLGVAREEMARWGEYRYLLVNDDLDSAYEVLRAIVLAEHHRRR
jgi:guanylate kinase